jgi:hypothetical protein
MRCMGCGAGMRLIAVVPDRELETPGYEHHTFECSGCGEQETRLAFSREPTRPSPPDRESSQPSEPLEPLRPAASVSPAPVPPVTVAQDVPPVTVAEEPSAPSLTATARTAWESAVARLRSRQSALSEQAENVKKAEHLARFDREWEKLGPQRKPSISAQITGRAPIPAKPAKRTEAATRRPSSGLWARAVAKLRPVEDGSER